MPEPSLQRIEDRYIQRGFEGTRLRKALETDEEYQKILAERKNRLTKKFKVTPEEEKQYVLSVDEDYEILGKVQQLEKKKLSREDKRFVQFIRTQLEWDWRKPFLKILDELLSKYRSE